MALYLENEICLMEDTNAYLYRWTNVTTGMWYVGSRTAKGSHPEDGYCCSSKVVKPMILENPNEWKREILVIGNPLYIRDLENKYLTKMNAAKDPMSFNKTNADGKFHRTGMSHTNTTKEKLRVANLGSFHSDETREHFSKIRQGSGNPFYGKHHSDKTKEYFKTLYTGKKQTDDQIEAKRKRQLDVSRTDNAKNSISKGVLALPKINCDHCDREFSPALYGRWHGDKCKSKGTNNE